MTEQDEQLARVAHNIETAVLAYVLAVPVGGEFLGSELEHFVMGAAAATPGSATRILRLLRARRVIGYRVSNRSKARYQRVALTEPKQLDFGDML